VSLRLQKRRSDWGYVAGGSVQFVAGWLAAAAAPTTAPGVFGAALLAGLTATALGARLSGGDPGAAAAGG